jgi:hypothetical protein
MRMEGIAVFNKNCAPIHGLWPVGLLHLVA